jgi:hypothetical protein
MDENLIGIIAVGGGMAVAAYSMYIRYRLREMQHRERLAMIDKGMAPTTLVRSSEHRHSSRSRGVLLVAVGIGLALLLGLGKGRGAEGYAIGLFIACVGAAFLINSVIDRKHGSDRPGQLPPEP